MWYEALTEKDVEVLNGLLKSMGRVPYSGRDHLIIIIEMGIESNGIGMRSFTSGLLVPYEDLPLCLNDTGCVCDWDSEYKELNSIYIRWRLKIGK